ncbi:hypothetical protein LCGC14_1263730 [marine sediment metagenome]|uniref:26 kDa periplasmic immunogenic protein n=1 Tax=marine sediment metagenome TaxID=412755 RepID=A0A0F9LLB5_9ZZZZ
MQILKMAVIMWGVLATVVQAQETNPGITVNGESVVSQAPDMATISLGVSKRAPSASEAMANTSEKVRGILAKLDTLQVAGLDRQTSGLYLRPVYDEQSRDGSTSVQVVGYEAGNTVRVTVRDLTKLGLLMDMVVAEGANDFNGLQFGIRDSSQSLLEARKNAVADAIARATQLAEAAGVKLGDVISMSESSQGFRPMEMRMSQMKSMDTPIETGEVDVRVQVTVHFAILQGN